MTLSTSFASQNNVGRDGNASDRNLGEKWERNFIALAKEYGWEGWRFAAEKGPTFVHNGRRYCSPDVWILRRGDTQYACEIKHKEPARNGCYGLEAYRYSSLIDLGRFYANQFGPVTPLYVIHNHALSGGKLSEVNDVAHWSAVDLMLVIQDYMGYGDTYYKGGKVGTHIYYYSVKQFHPLIEFLAVVDEVVPF